MHSCTPQSQGAFPKTTRGAAHLDIVEVSARGGRKPFIFPMMWTFLACAGRALGTSGIRYGGDCVMPPDPRAPTGLHPHRQHLEPETRHLPGPPTRLMLKPSWVNVMAGDRQSNQRQGTTYQRPPHRWRDYVRLGQNRKFDFHLRPNSAHRGDRIFVGKLTNAQSRRRPGRNQAQPSMSCRKSIMPLAAILKRSFVASTGWICKCDANLYRPSLRC